MMARSVSGLIPLFVSLTAILVATPSALSSAAWATSAPQNSPPEVVTHFTPEDVARGRAYMGGRYWLFAGGTALRLLALVLLVVTPASAALRSLAVRLAPTRPAVAVAIYIAMLVLAFELLTLPLGYYAGYVREHAFGLSTQSFASWAWDHTKAALIGTGIMLPLLVLLYSLIRWNPDRWYVPAWVVSVAVMALMAELSPILFDPLFHTFRPVTDPGLVERIHTLADRAGLRVGSILEMDASRQTKKTNAYFTGLGRTRRVVLYDTLIATSTPEDVELVLAHELGHWRRHHIWKGIALGAASILAALWVIARLLNAAAGSGRFGFIHPADIVSLPLLLLSFLVLDIVTMPVQTAVSRAFEREADLESLRLTDNPDAFIASEVTLARTNLADIEPPKAIVWFIYTHPPVLERIAMAEAYRATEQR